MATPMLAPAEGAIAELAFVLFLWCPRFAGRGRRRVGGHGEGAARSTILAGSRVRPAGDGGCQGRRRREQGVRA